MYGISQNPDTNYLIVLQDIYCEKCAEKYTNISIEWCRPCQLNYLNKNHTIWTSGDETIDNLIQEMRLKIVYYADVVFEWIPYDQFNDIKEIGKDGPATIYSAIWKDGPLYYNSENNNNEYIRSQNKKVSLKYLHNSQNAVNEFLNE